MWLNGKAVLQAKGKISHPIWEPQEGDQSGEVALFTCLVEIGTKNNMATVLYFQGMEFLSKPLEGHPEWAQPKEMSLTQDAPAEDDEQHETVATESSTELRKRAKKKEGPIKLPLMKGKCVHCCRGLSLPRRYFDCYVLNCLAGVNKLLTVYAHINTTKDKDGAVT